MIDARIASVARRQRGVVSIRQLLACGLSRRAVGARVQAARLFPVLRGVYALAPHLDDRGLRYAAVLHAGGDDLDGTVVLSHWSAAAALDLIAGVPPRHHVTIVGVNGRRASGVVLHRARRLDDSDVHRSGGIPTTTAPRTVLDIAAIPSTSVDQLQRLLREGQYRRLIPLDGLLDVVARHPRHPGRRKLRLLDPRLTARQGTESPLEDEVAALLEGLPLPPAIRQLPLTGATGRRCRADFAWPDARLVVEADGRDGHGGSAAFEADRERDADLAAAGWLVLRLTTAQLRSSRAATADRIVATHRLRATGRAPAVTAATADPAPTRTPAET